MQTTGAGGRIAIIGAGESAQFAPWKDPDIRFWGIGVNVRNMPKLSRVFEMHDRNAWTKYIRKYEAGYSRELASLGVPVVMRERYDDIPMSERYPFERVIETFGDYATNFFAKGYFVSSIAYMIAFAILENAEEIGLYGINLTSPGEYGYQKPNAEFWVGVAIGCGVKVVIHQSSPLCRTRNPYGTMEWFQSGADAKQRAHYAVGLRDGNLLAY